MSTATAPSPQRVKRASRRPSAQLVWSVSLLVVAVLAFVFYNNILPDLQDSIAQGVQRWANLSAINECLCYAIFALGLNVVVGYAGLLDLGYVAFWAIGAYAGAYLMSAFIYKIKKGIHFGSPSTVATQPGIHLNFWLVLFLAAMICAFFGLVVGGPTLRLRGDYLAIVTLGFGEIIPQIFVNGDHIAGRNLTNGARGITGLDPLNTDPFNHLQGVPNIIFGVNSAFKLLIMFFLVAFCIFVSLRIRGGRLGRSWLAIREDELAANMMGVPLVKAKLSAYAVGAFFGGIGGVAFASNVQAAFATSFNFQKSIFILIMVVLGGMGNVWGVLVGALVLSWINNTGMQEFGNSFNGWFGTSIEIPNYTFLIFGIILVLMMLFRREGLLPERRTQQIMREPSRTELESMGSDVEAGQADQAEELLSETSTDHDTPPTDRTRS